MNHKRGRPKNARAGCLMCKPHKANGSGGLKLQVQKVGFGRIRKTIHAEADLHIPWA